jgi:hypothetical protein
MWSRWPAHCRSPIALAFTNAQINVITSNAGGVFGRCGDFTGMQTADGRYLACAT